MKIKTTIKVNDVGMFVCVLMLLITTFIYPFLVSPAMWIITEVVCVAAVLVIIIIRGTMKISQNFLFWLITLFPILYNSTSLKMNEFGFSLLWVTLLLVIVEGIQNTKWIRCVVPTVLILTGIYVFSTILLNLNITAGVSEIGMYFRTQIGSGTLKTAGFTSHYSHNGMYIATGCVACFAYMLEKKNISRILLMFMFVLALLFTQKRGVLIALIVAVLVTYYFAQKGNLSTRLSRLMIMLIVALVAVYVLYIITPEAFAVFERFTQDDNVLTNRQYLWKYAWECFKENPILGKGWGSYSHSLLLIIDTVQVTDMNTHNIYLQLLAETGFIGFACFMSAILYTLIKSIKLIKIINEKCMPLYFSTCMQFFFLIYGVSGNPLYDKQMITPYMIAVAIIYSYNRHLQESGEKTNEDCNNYI